MTYYHLSRYTYLVPLATGRLAMRTVCPSCRSIHSYPREGKTGICGGCGRSLTRHGEVLCVSPTPTPQTTDVVGSKTWPYNPGFWYDGRDW